MSRAILLEALKTFVVVPQIETDQAMADSATALLHWTFEQVVAGLSDEQVDSMITTALDQTQFTNALQSWITTQ